VDGLKKKSIEEEILSEGMFVEFGFLNPQKYA
jgi:hypothetical protein